MVIIWYKLSPYEEKNPPRHKSFEIFYTGTQEQPLIVFQPLLHVLDFVKQLKNVRYTYLTRV